MEHGRETGNAAGRIGNLTELRLWHPCVSLAGGAAPGGSRVQRGARPSPQHTPAWPAQKDRQNYSGKSFWGFNPLYVSSAVLKWWCDVLFTHGSGKAPRSQVATLCSVCLRENTSFAQVTDEKGSMPVNQIKWI